LPDNLEAVEGVGVTMLWRSLDTIAVRRRHVEVLVSRSRAVEQMVALEPAMCCLLALRALLRVGFVNHRFFQSRESLRVRHRGCQESLTYQA